jgi:hypothetical protein
MTDDIDRQAIEAHADIVFRRTLRNIARIVIPVLIFVGVYLWYQHYSADQQHQRECELSRVLCDNP